jgi:protease-4
VGTEYFVSLCTGPKAPEKLPNMKNFFGSLLGSFLGVIVATIIAVLIVAGLIAGALPAIFKEKDKAEKVSDSSVLKLRFDKKISERTSKNIFSNLSLSSFSSETPLGLNDILAELNRAKTDNRIRGVFLDLSVVPSGIATIEELRNALLDFKKSGKFIVSYGEFYTQGAFYLATAADKIYLNPAGSIEWKGLSAQIMFFKGMFEKLEIDAQIFRHGKFKSAVEPFDLSKMSAANREQTAGYIGSIWQHIEQGVSERRQIPVEELKRIADNLLIQSASDAKQYQLVDELLYADQVYVELNRLTQQNAQSVPAFISIEGYHNLPHVHPDQAPAYTQDKIAVVYAVGQIESGEGDENTIGSEKISRAIREARTDNKVKAIVLRVNSPGGSALASDVIWREVVLARKSKPVIVSMGDVAASGGYYIACAADRIFAEPNTITGSIGVFGMLPDLQKLMNHKLGITVDTVNTNVHSDMGTPFRPVTAREREYIMKGIEHVYADFITKVGSGRKMDTAAVDAIGQGRVWSGTDALKKGLVDELGGIKEALAAAAAQAKIGAYQVLALPEQKEGLSAFISELSGGAQSRAMLATFGEHYTAYLAMKKLLMQKGIQARMPYDIVLY